MLLIRNLKGLSPSKKLAPKYLGPFQIEKRVGNIGLAYILKMLGIRIYNVFLVLLLKLYKGKKVLPLDYSKLKGKDIYNVKKILDQRGYGSTYKYLICQKGQEPKDDIQESPQNVSV